MPAAIAYSHQLGEAMTQLRKDRKHTWLRPDSKTQVSIEYVDGKPNRITAVVVSTMHAKEISTSEIREALKVDLIEKVLPQELLTEDTKYHINPTGLFVVGGPEGDCGLTGRKIIVDTYGGMGRHGGGAFSGKDPSKVDRSAAYMCSTCEMDQTLPRPSNTIRFNCKMSTRVHRNRVWRKTCVRRSYKNSFGHAPTSVSFSGLLGWPPEHMPVGFGRAVAT